MSHGEYKKLRIQHVGGHNIDQMQFLCPIQWTVGAIKEFIASNNQQLKIQLVTHKIAIIHAGCLLQNDKIVSELPARNTGEIILWMQLDPNYHNQESSQKKSNENDQETKKLVNLKRNYFVSVLLEDYVEKVGKNNIIYSLPTLNRQWSNYIENESQNKENRIPVVDDPKFPIRTILHICLYYITLQSHFRGNQFLLIGALIAYLIAEIDSYRNLKRKAQERRNQLEQQRKQQQQLEQKQKLEEDLKKKKQSEIKQNSFQQPKEPKTEEQQNQVFSEENQVPLINLGNLSNFEKVNAKTHQQNRKNKPKSSNRLKRILMMVYELIFCFFISLFPHWNVHDYVANNRLVSNNQEIEEKEDQTKEVQQEQEEAKIKNDDELPDKDEKMPLDSLTLTQQISLSPTLELKRDLEQLIDHNQRKQNLGIADDSLVENRLGTPLISRNQDEQNQNPNNEQIDQKEKTQ